MTMTYSLTIQNSSEADQNVALFQVDDPESGFPLIWWSQKIPNGNNYTFTWDESWQVGFGSTSQPLKADVSYVSQNKQEVKPNEASGVNEIKITFEDESFKSSKPYYNDQISNGVIQIITDKSFTVEQALNMSVAVYMYNKPILASQGKPNSQYRFYTNTIYYLTVTDIPEGSVVFQSSTQSNSSMRSVESQPTKVNFSDGNTCLKYKLNNLLVFAECDS